MVELSGALWRLDWIVEQLSRWGATGVAFFEVRGLYSVVRREGRTWKNYHTILASTEQIEKLKSRAALSYSNYSGTDFRRIVIFIIPHNQTEAAKTELAELIQKEMLADGRQ
jgi:hypothetical protein